MTITIKININDLKKEISTLAYQIGETCTEGEQRFIMQGMFDDNNFKSTKECMKGAAVTVLQTLSAYIVGSNLNEFEDATDIEFNVSLHENSANAIEFMLPDKIKAYIVNFVISEWLTINNHPNAQVYAAKSVVYLSDVRYTINQRKTKKYNWL